jgi:tetratricopeptide (TPR) repeat protein
VLVAGVLLFAAVVSLDYEALIRRYAAGERDVAVAALGTWRPGELDRQVRALQRARPACPSCPDPIGELPLKAAVMLHLDRDILEHPRSESVEHARPCPGDHARRAGQIAAVLAERNGTGAFARRFFLAMANRSQWDFCLDAAQQWAHDGLDRFPRDPSLLLALGSTSEEKATLANLPDQDPAGHRTAWFREAERALAEAVRADPDLFEARIRLGRVRWYLGQDESARETLEDALRRGGPPPLPYLGQLFLGQALERAGRAGEAARAYQEALALEPQSQAAAVALSHLRLSSGDAAGARRALGEALAHAGWRAESDPYWIYPASNAGGAEDALEALRLEASQ